MARGNKFSSAVKVAKEKVRKDEPVSSEDQSTGRAGIHKKRMDGMRKARKRS